MAFKTSQTGHGSYTDGDLMWMNANNLFSKGYDNTTMPSNGVKITASDAAIDNEFGASVAVGSGRIVVGAYKNTAGGISRSGAAYIFDLEGNELSKITPNDAAVDDLFGAAVAVGCDRIVVSAPFDDDVGDFSGSAYIFDLEGNQLAKITASNGASLDNFGYSNETIDIANNRIVVGSPFNDSNGTGSGCAYIYDLEGNELAILTANDPVDNAEFGSSVAIGSNRIVVGAPGDDDNGTASGSIYVFDIYGKLLSKITPVDGAAFNLFGKSVSIAQGRIVVGAPGASSGIGAAYIFDLNGNQIAKRTGLSENNTNNKFGDCVLIGQGRIFVGAPGSGSTNTTVQMGIFDLDGNYINFLGGGNLKSFGTTYGAALAVGSGKLIVGAPLENEVFNDDGAAFIYDIQNSPTHVLDIFN